MKRLTVAILTVFVLILAPSAVDSFSFQQPVKVADPEPGYLCKICPKCCKEKSELDEEDPQESGPQQVS